MNGTLDSTLPRPGDVVRITGICCGCDGTAEPCGLHHFEGRVAVVDRVAPGVLDDIQRFYLRGIGLAWFDDELEVLVPAVAGAR